MTLLARCDVRRTSWPSGTRSGGERKRVGIVVAHFNTSRLVAHLVFSLYRLLGGSEFAQLVVVDNASTDRSRQLLNALHRARLIHLIRNRCQRYHGPALTQGISWLARRQLDVTASERLDYLVFERLDAAAVGQKMGSPAYSRLLRHNREMLDPFSLMLDPARIWRPPIPPFLEDGAPATALQVAADEGGLRLVEFPFVENGYVLHLGRGTLREVANAGDTTNRYYGWAVDHREYHFAGQGNGAQLLRAFADLFDTEVGRLSPERLVQVCLQPDLLVLA